ncbi:unnamed protein product [Diatraea saccharalis]|uniref:Uncharacterized protein n=1 Tax=Diatraea saccharalis TaxID=40085 RepID=A0A9N9WIV3_9NEOP|nr:unnamed protein product [Diatraea saccharalis]
MNLFENDKKSKDWLNTVFLQGKLKDTELSPKSVQFINLSTRQQLRCRRKLEANLAEEPKPKKIKTFVQSMSGSDESTKMSTKVAKDFEFVIDQCLQSGSTTIANKIRHPSPQPYSPQEALSVIIDKKLTVDTYKFLQTDLKERNCSVFPPYHKVLEIKKSCYPLEEVQNATQELYCIFEGSWGFDGSSGQALYKQNLGDDDDELSNENSLFATTFIPLKISTKDSHELWLNPTPQSYRSCRPLRIQYKKETTELIKSEKKIVDDQITQLKPLSAKTSKGYTIHAECVLYLIVIDGKVLNIILDTPSQLRCPFCGITSTQFNKLEVCYEKIPRKEALMHGISPLHAWIRVLEFLLKLGYKSEVKTWRIPQTSPEYQLLEQRKKYVQTQIRKQIGVLVDVVKPNSGTTNDGNAARTLLSDKYRQTFSEIINIEKWLLDDLHTILIVLSCGLPFGIKEFKVINSTNIKNCKVLSFSFMCTYHKSTI